MSIMEILNSLEDTKKLNRYRCGMDFFFNEVVSHYVALTNLLCTITDSNGINVFNLFIAAFIFP